jgi:hypothetical protein
MQSQAEKVHAKEKTRLSTVARLKLIVSRQNEATACSAAVRADLRERGSGTGITWLRPRQWL